MTRIDWRASGGRPPLEIDALPPPIEARCRDLMRRLGLVFGCLDLLELWRPGLRYVRRLT